MSQKSCFFVDYGTSQNGGKGTLQKSEAKTRVEVYLPKRHVSPYRETLAWLIDELTAMRGGCSVHENVAGYYQSAKTGLDEDRICLVYSDFEMDWFEPAERAEALEYCATLKQFLKENLWEEEELLISAYPVSHVSE